VYLRDALYNKYVINKASEGGSNEHAKWESDSLPEGIVVAIRTDWFSIKKSIFFPDILIMNANKMHCFSYLFDKVLYMFRTSALSITRSISKLYTRNRY
jgi:hypothetical protein